MKLRVKRIIFVTIICVLGIIALCSPIRFQTDLTSLLNLGNVDGWPIQYITDRFSSGINIVVQSKDRLNGEIAVHNIRELVNSDGFSEFDVITNDLSVGEFKSSFGKYHNVMIGANDRRLLKSGQFSDITKNAGVKIESSISPNILPLSDDPFLLFTNYLYEMAKNNHTNWAPQNGALWQYRAPYNFYMVPLRTNFTDNDNLVNSVTKLKEKIEKINNVQVYIGGAPIHTAEMYARSKIELGIISVLAIFTVIVLNYMLFRRFRTILPIIATLGVGYLSGTIALFLCFGAPHILVFVFGTSLIGLGIDYAFHFMNVGDKKDEKLVQKNIWHSLLTTVVCFAPLMFSSISLLRQISVFTVVGLSAIYIFIRLFVSCRAKSPKLKFVQPLNHKSKMWVLGGLVLVTLVACCFVQIENNMTSIYKPNGQLAVAERKIGELNQSNKLALLVVRGNDIQQVLETEENIRDSGINFFGISSIVPSHLRQLENQELVKNLYAYQSNNIRKTLGLKTTPRFVVSPEIEIENQDLQNWINNFLMEYEGRVYSVSSVSADAVIDNENAQLIVPGQKIQSQMTKYSHEIYRLLLVCGVVLVVILMILYRWRAFRYLLPPLLGVGVAIGVLAIFGVPITFFHLLGLFIVIGLGLDYAIFHINSGHGGEMWPVFYSFLTSFIGFGLLAFTSFSLISALGITLAIGIAVSYVVSLYLFRN